MNKSQNKKSGNKLNKLNNLSADDEDRKMRKLFVDRLNASITEDDIYSVFSKHGEIEEVAKYQDRRAPSRYFAFVVYKYAKDCVKATYDPCPIIRGRKCNCMLAAIGKQFSGYKFFVQKGLLTEEEKQNQKNSSNNNNNNNNNNSNKRINNNNNKKRNNNKHNMNNNNMNVNNNTKMDNNKSHPQINIPSFKDDMNNSHHSSRSAIVSNYEDNTPVNSVNYDNYPSWHSQFDSHTSQCSYSTNISEQPLPSYNQSKSFNYNNNIRREYVPQKSLYKDPRRYNNNTPYIQYQQHSNPTTWHQYQPQQQPVSQPIPQQQQIPQYNISYSNNNAPNAHFRRTRAQSMTNILPQYYTQQQQPQHNTQQQQQPTLQSYSYSQMQPQRNPPQMQPRVQYSPIIPPMTQSVSYTQLPHPPRQYTNTMSNPPPKLQYSRKQNIQQSSAPKLPGLTTNNNTTNKCNTPTPSMFKSHSARSSQSAHSIFHNDSNPPIIGDDLDLLDEFADLELTPNGLPPTPSPPPCLLLSLNAGAKPSIDMDRDEFFDTLKVPRAKTFTSVVAAKNATDKELEAGFTMLSSPTPTATASVHTEYNDSEDLHNFELNPTKN